MTESGTIPPNANPNPERDPEDAPDDEYHLQGRRIITEDDLDEVFEDDGVEPSERYLRRRILHGVVLTLLVALLGAAVLVAFAVSRGDLQVPGWEPRPEARITCPPDTYKYPANHSFVTNVYNSTTQGGLARQTSEALAKRGYKIGVVDSKRINYYGLSAIIVSGPKGEANAMNLQRNIAGTEYVADERTDSSVDVILGSQYKNLVPAKKVNKKAGTLSCPRLEQQGTTPSANATK
ncbi:LytR C-terminal domain-containing protein [Arthrobacter sp. I2-34]|uniref:LytR C-terminal domain-containing protein n=1 Tax=Arthrobacter hankyongi TaxID=2904801 RepID=A0ABS9L9I7_9MICC|nr:LytR C-terminal domain-containing protein [Arthrobacter hankyongi]MCG2623366.1 LytR C-terminal domain-containing protein [Arthrobacter hankyongi]